MLNYDVLDERALKTAIKRRKNLLTEKRMRDIVLYCVSMDEIPLSVISDLEKAVSPRFFGGKTRAGKAWNPKIIQKFTVEFGPL